MIIPTIAAVIADVLDLGPAHGIGPSTVADIAATVARLTEERVAA